MPLPMAIEIAFDPILRFGDLELRWQTIGLTAALLVALAVAASIGGHLPGAPPLLERRPVHRPIRRRLLGVAYPPAPRVTGLEQAAADPLRLEDLVFVCLAVVPGAVAGGRLFHAIAFADAYLAQPERLLDPGTGSLSLLGAVIGGTLSAAWICRLLGASARRWADAAAVPMLLVLGLGKLAQLLGGSGQGAAFEGPWAVAFTGEFAWISSDPAVPAHPSQVYEGLWLLLGIPVVLALAGPGADLGGRLGRWRRLAGRLRGAGALFLGALAWFLLGRVFVGFSWRDDRLSGAFNAEQLAALGVLLVLLLVALIVGRRRPSLPVDGRSGPARYREGVHNER